MIKGNEIINIIGHVIVGGTLCYLFIPTADLWILVLFTSGCGAVREHIQELRGHANNPKFIKYIDVIGFTFGSIIYYELSKRKYIDADKYY